jgi:hypothetical protein
MAKKKAVKKPKPKPKPKPKRRSPVAIGPNEGAKGALPRKLKVRKNDEVIFVNANTVIHTLNFGVSPFDAGGAPQSITINPNRAQGPYKVVNKDKGYEFDVVPPAKPPGGPGEPAVVVGGG